MNYIGSKVAFSRGGRVLFMDMIKKITWVLSVIVLANSVFADDSEIARHCENCKPKEPVECDPCYEKSRDKLYDQGYGICEDILPEAYNAPGRIDICKDIDLYVTGNFIYWKPLLDQVEIGITRFEDTSGENIFFEDIKFITDYKPGFKVGFGYNFSHHDNWHIYSQYTRLHETKSINFVPTRPSGITSGVFYPTNIGFPVTGSIPGSDINTTFKIELDKIDFELGRVYYIGANLITTLFAGATCHFLDQSYDQFVINIPSSVDFKTFFKNDSWAIGPRLGLETKWIFYRGFRLFANGAFSLMFSENDMSGLFVVFTSPVVTRNYKKVKKEIIRDVEELAIGFGWGSYFVNDKLHIDLSVAYEAQRYSHTNYMNYYSHLVNTGISSTFLEKPGDAFLHGLTVSARLDF
ncbi:MAG: hypothetical protein K1060chlam1_00521 [Candidatus Anoxychlamydiales bacterium]|nr:hypothetical protein [Candidatus Anoxychlamydiales bacterium]